MLTKRWRRKPGLALAVTAAVMSFSGLAQAQQSGLFPLHPIKRQRTPCSQEEPIYKLYRDQYYGYFPTQWRQFPRGWNLPSEYGPNTQEELRKLPIEAPKPPPSDIEGGDQEAPGIEPGVKPPIPNPPAEDERSPFEMDNPANPPAVRPTPGAGAPRNGTQVPRLNTPAPATETSPFDVPDSNPAGRPQASRSARPAAPAGSAPGGPELAAPGRPAAAPPRTSWNRQRSNERRQSDPGPILAMSDATLPAVEEADGTASHSAAPLADVTQNDPAPAGTNAAPDQAPAAPQPPPPARRGPISSFFAGLGMNWLRR